MHFHTTQEDKTKGLSRKGKGKGNLNFMHLNI
jgi:hypothetical protein